MKKYYLHLVIFLMVFSMSITSIFPNNGVILNPKVNVYEEPSFGTKIIAKVMEGERVRILNRIIMLETIGSTTDGWAKVSAPGVKTGYVFGSYVFSINSLYSGVWSGFTPSLDTRWSIMFFRNGTYITFFDYPYNSPGVNFGKETGTFTIIGNEIRYTVKSATPERNSFPGMSYTNYMFRLNGRDILSTVEYIAGGNNNFRGDKACNLIYNTEVGWRDR